VLDSHNHLHQLPDPDAAITTMREAGIDGCVVNGTCESDWPQVADLAERHPDFVRPAFGLHPWQAHRRGPHWLETLREFLERLPLASVGECGLDRWVEEPDLDPQRDAFLPQLALARELDRPVTIHALKAWGPLLDALETEPPPAAGFLLHSYGGSAEFATQLLPLGARFSASGHFLHPRKADQIEVFRGLPPERLLLETDAPSMTPPAELVTHPLDEEQNHPANLAAIVERLAARLDRDPAELVRQADENARDLKLFS